LVVGFGVGFWGLGFGELVDWWMQSVDEMIADDFLQEG
jgi:hypothetical protein